MTSQFYLTFRYKMRPHVAVTMAFGSIEARNAWIVATTGYIDVLETSEALVRL